ncbi:MAG TPA: hypothetical protein VNY10_09545 [Roseiarcus sp.]|nr:hypothetical protein [Roseiarcus sp.]
MRDSSTMGATVLRQGRRGASYLLALSVISLPDYMLGTLAAFPALLGHVSLGSLARAGLGLDGRGPDDEVGMARNR